MTRLSALAIALVFAIFASIWHVQFAAGQADKGWITLFDGKNLDQWNTTGDANWKVSDGSVVADKGNGFLVSKAPYTDFEIRAEFWVDDDANSGIFIRCQDDKKLGSKECYEVNIFDKRPAPEYGTGAIVDVAKVDPMPKAGGKWNIYEITARGGHLVVVLNGVKTADVENSQHKSGFIGLQHGIAADKTDKGVVKFRKVEIKPL
ncbi:MAG: DUF1080 domain-containing protein [Rhodomicrobium sp.]